MKTFLVQKVDGEVKYDFSFHLLEAIRYNNWFKNEKVYGTLVGGFTETTNCVPVGSLEFVFDYMKKHFGIEKKDIQPINIPKELFKDEFLKRKCEILDKSEMIINKDTFVKSATEYKSFTEVVSDVTQVPDGKYLVSEVVDIQSEWRAFVYNGVLVGLNHYIGDFTRFPDVHLIDEMIAEYKDCPPAYTLDVGVNDNGTFVIEVHPFVSCGLYGFKDYRILPEMFISAFDYLVKELKK